MGPTPRTPAPPCTGTMATPLHWAAHYDNRRLVRSLVAFNADVNAKTRHGCAVSARGESAVECADRVAAAVCRADSRR